MAEINPRARALLNRLGERLTAEHAVTLEDDLKRLAGLCKALENVLETGDRTIADEVYRSLPEPLQRMIDSVDLEEFTAVVG